MYVRCFFGGSVFSAGMSNDGHQYRYPWYKGILGISIEKGIKKAVGLSAVLTPASTQELVSCICCFCLVTARFELMSVLMRIHGSVIQVQAESPRHAQGRVAPLNSVFV